MKKESERQSQQMLKDLLWLNAVIAVELTQITENTFVTRTSGNVTSTSGNISYDCLKEHDDLKKTAVEIAEKYKPRSPLPKHVKPRNRE